MKVDIHDIFLLANAIAFTRVNKNEIFLKPCIYGFEGIKQLGYHIFMASIKSTQSIIISIGTEYWFILTKILKIRRLRTDSLSAPVVVLSRLPKSNVIVSQILT